MTFEQLSYWVGRTLVDAYARLVLRMDVEYHAALPAGAKILAANHPTTTDPFYLMSIVSDQMSILVTELAFEVPVFGDYLRSAQHIPVLSDRGGLAFDQARQRLDAGGTIGIFPEGALSPLVGGPRVHGARTGAVRLALSTGTPIIPVGIYMDPARIRYSEVQTDSMSDTARWYPAGPYAVTVGKAIHLDGNVEDRAYVRSASEYVMEYIAHLARQSDLRLREERVSLGLAGLLGRREIVEQA
jgi:1-acyl-sn-glycerol-3-phosphate acyltransferase